MFKTPSAKLIIIMSNYVSPQITDAVSQTNVKVVGEAPAMAMGSVYQTAAHSTGLMFENAVNAQSQQNILAQTTTTQGVMQIYSFDTMVDAISISQMLRLAMVNNKSFENRWRGKCREVLLFSSQTG